MIRQLVVAGAISAAAIGAMPAAYADDTPGRYSTDVPGMNYEAALNAPCENTELFIFGRGRGGEALACHYIPNQWPPVYTGFWVTSYPLYGVQQVGAPCPSPQAAAQDPGGRAMLCLGERGWQPAFFTGNGLFEAD